MYDTGAGISPEIIDKLGEIYATYNLNGMNSSGIGWKQFYLKFNNFKGIGLFLCNIIISELGP